jgi:isochorismate hydrolase
MPNWTARSPLLSTLLSPLLSTLLVSATGLAAAGCTAAPVADPGGSFGRPADPNSQPPNPAADPPADPSATPASRGALAVVAIDLQQVFFDTASARNPTSGIAQRMALSAHVFELAGDHHVPVFMTFEATMTGDHALPPSLTAALPPSSLKLVKTTFAATSHPQFLPAIKASGAQRLMVLGAETDVCILQTVLGLRRAGYEVITVTDAIFTQEINIPPAVRRLRQAGVVELGTADAEALLTAGGSSPAPPATTARPVILRPLETGILLHDLEGLGAADANASQKMVRLHELLLVSEWFRLPVFAADPAGALAALPANVRSVLTRPIAPLASRPSTVTQLAIAGGHAGIGAAVDALAGKVDAFLIEDTLLGGGSADLEPLYVRGAVPTTYKTLYYELTQSVSDAQWPSQQWVTDGARYFDLTMAPESLPPLAVP